MPATERTTVTKDTSNDTPAMMADVMATLSDREEVSEDFCSSCSCSVRHSAKRDGSSESGGSNSTDGVDAGGGKMGPCFLKKADETWSKLVDASLVLLSISVLLLAVSMVLTIARLGS